MAERPSGPFGASVRRVEDRRLLTGRGRYVADIRLDGALHAAILRSPHAHARIRAIDLTAARAAEGVVCAVSGPALGSALRLIPMRLTPMATLAAALQRPLATDRVRYVGEPVAVVVAADRYLAEDARELIRVEYEPLEPISNVQQALAAGAPLLHAAVGGNVVAEIATATGDVEAALASAHLVVRERFAIQRHAAVPLETRGLAAVWDPPAGKLTMWGPTKVPHFNRSVLAGLLDLPETAIRFVEPEVGGGFGARGEFYPEDFLVPYLARELGRAVVWIEDRGEHLAATNHSRQQEHDVELGLSRDGRIVALKDRFWCDMGAYVRTHGATVPSLTAAMLPGPYRIPNYACRATCVLTNKTPTGTYRGPGRFEANFVRERLLDLAAARLGLPPEEVRRRNFVEPAAMPYDVGTDALATRTVYDSGDFGALFERALARFDLADARRRQAEGRAEGRLIGIGIGYFVEKSGLGPWEYARLELGRDGRLTAFTGNASLGQGTETALAQICAQVLGVGVGDVAVVHGDTDRVPRGGGAFASRGTVMAGASAHLASQALARRLLQAAAARLEVSPTDLELHEAGVSVRGTPGRSLSLAELAEGGRGEVAFAEEAVFESRHMAYPYGAHLALVEVDAATGQISVLRYLVAYDVGRAVNPMLVVGQIVGGVAQGIGGTLLEDLVYDQNGQLQAGTFVDYLLPTAMEVPPVDVLMLEDAPSPLNPLGVKGAGEGGTVGVAPAIANAVWDALRPLGVDVAELPVSPDRVRQAIRGRELEHRAAGRCDGR